MTKFTAVIATSNRIVSVEAPDKDMAEAEINRQLLLNPQRREIWQQWQADGAYIVNEEIQDEISEADAVARLVGSLRCLLAKWDDHMAWVQDHPDVVAAVENARDALTAYDRRAA